MEQKVIHQRNLNLPMDNIVVTQKLNEKAEIVLELELDSFNYRQTSTSFSNSITGCHHNRCSKWFR
jgi:hypothetical protein